MNLSAGFFVILSVLAAAAPAFCVFRIDPHQVLIVEAPVGKKAPAEGPGQSIQIYNEDSSAQTYTVEVKKPGDVARTVMFGYDPVPDTAFLKAESDVTVGPKQKGTVKLWTDVPQNPDHYNRKWEAEVVVKQAGAGIGVSLVAQAWIESEGKTDLEAPSGKSYMAGPATVVMRGSSGKGEFKIYNVSKSSLTLLLVSESPPAQLKGDFISYSHGFERLPEEEWVEVTAEREQKVTRIKKGREIAPIKKVVMKAGESRKVALRLKVPGSQDSKGKKWESFVFLRCPDLNENKFVRIQVLP